MSLIVLCGNCAERLTAPDHLAGQQVQCPTCGSLLRLPKATPIPVTPVKPAPQPAPAAPMEPSPPPPTRRSSYDEADDRELRLADEGHAEETEAEEPADGAWRQLVERFDPHNIKRFVWGGVLPGIVLILAIGFTIASGRTGHTLQAAFALGFGLLIALAGVLAADRDYTRASFGSAILLYAAVFGLACYFPFALWPGKLREWTSRIPKQIEVAPVDTYDQKTDYQKHVWVAEELEALHNELADTLRSIIDVASAEAARDKLNELDARWSTAVAREKELPELTGGDRSQFAAATARRQVSIDSARQAIQAESSRLQRLTDVWAIVHPSVPAALKERFPTLGAAM